MIRSISPRRFAPRPWGFFLAASVTLAMTLPRAAHAGPEGVAAGAAVAAVVVQAVGTLADWVGRQDNDCYVAALGAAWGEDCNLNKNECTDTDFTRAACEAEGSNDCGLGIGRGDSSEGIFGQNWVSVIKPGATAVAKALHGANDAHAARGWGKAGVDGTSQCKEEATPGAAPGWRKTDEMPGPLAPGAPVTLVAQVRVDTLILSRNPAGGGHASVRLALKIDDLPVWSASASLDEAGVVTLTGGLSGVPWIEWIDPVTGYQEVRIHGYTYDYIIGSFGGGSTPAERDVHVEFDGDATADAAGSQPGEPVYLSVTPADLRLVDAEGEPALAGQHVQVTTPLTLMCAPHHFGPAIVDAELYDPQSGLSVGVLDFVDQPGLPPGTPVWVRGFVTHHEGRTVLCWAQIDPAGSPGPMPPALPLPIAALLADAEQREGALVQIDGAHLVGGSWPTRRESSVVQVIDPSGAVIDVELDADTDIDGSLAPVGPFQLTGFLSQYDPGPAPPAGAANLAPASSTLGGPGYFSGYRIRPRWRADIIGVTAGAADPVAPTGPRPFELRQNQPNPFHPVTEIRFRMNQAGPARLTVYSVDGRRVRTLLDGHSPQGEQGVLWDGRDDSGRPLASGLYLYAFEAAGQRQTRKMLMTR